MGQRKKAAHRNLEMKNEEEILKNAGRESFFLDFILYFLYQMSMNKFVWSIALL